MLVFISSGLPLDSFPGSFRSIFKFANLPRELKKIVICSGWAYCNEPDTKTRMGLFFLLSREIIPTYGDFVRDELRKNAPYTLKKASKLANDVAWKHGLFESIRFAGIFWPLTPFIMRLTRRIKIGQHYIKRNKKIKKIIGIDTNNTDYINEIEKLSSLKDKGIITDEEFQAKKKDLLGQEQNIKNGLKLDLKIYFHKSLKLKVQIKVKVKG